MSQVIIFRNDNGGVALCIPTGELPIETVLEKDVPPEKGARIVDRSSLPSDYYFYDAWEMDDTAVIINFAKAQELTKDRLRAERQPLLQAQDVAFQRALETGADTSAIVAEKQRLRDITQLADQATTLEELRNLKV
jgi:hypothetical protein